MKLDSESAYCQPTLDQKPITKSVECDDIVGDTVALEPGEKLIKEIQNEVSCGIKGNESDANCLSSQMNRDGSWNVSEFDCSISDDSTNANEDDIKDFGEPYNHSSLVALYQKDSELYNAKESHDDVIKDICIDQGVTSLGKILFGDCVDDGKDNTMSITEDLKPSAKNDSFKELANQHGSVDPVQIDSSHSNLTEATEEKHVSVSIEPEEHLETKDSEPELSGERENGVNKQSHKIPNEEAMSKNSSSVSEVKEPNNSSNRSIVSPAPASTVEDSNKSPANDIAYDSKVEDGSITFNFDSSAPKEESSQKGDCANLATQNPDQIRHSPGESSFSVTGPVSGLVTYSGPIAYSGSCSLRSDSSTTSTRSFAFPVLQAEWNSSPVRMRKAEKSKCKGWKDGLLCCRF